MAPPLLLRLARLVDRSVPSPAKRLVRSFAPQLSERLYERLASRSPARREWVTITGGPLEGRRICCSLRTEQSYYLGTHEPAIATTLGSLPIGACVLDIGGHIGYTALAFATAVGRTGKVLVFEPLPANRERIAAHLAANPDLASQIEVVPAAVSDRAGLVHLSGSESQAHIAEQGIEVEATTIDMYLESRPLTPTLIKMDIEGAEVLALPGARETLRRCHPDVLVELHDRAAFETCVALLRSLGYEIEYWTPSVGWQECGDWRDREIYRATFRSADR